MNQLSKYYPYLILIIILGGLIFWLVRIDRSQSLADLENQLRQATTTEDRTQILNDLKEYYLNLAVPDSIERKLDSRVATIIDTTEIEAVFDLNSEYETNIYVKEKRLTTLLRLAMIASTRKEAQSFEELISSAENLAIIVDKGTENNYWKSFVQEQKVYSSENALAWLKAKTAANLCKYIIDFDYQQAEQLASLSLRNLRKANDERIRLEVMQRLQFVLSRDHRLFELSNALAKNSRENAIRIKNPVRVVGVTFYQAEAFLNNDQDDKAIKHLRKVVAWVDLYKEIPAISGYNISWYKIQALIRMIAAYNDLGLQEKALSIQKDLEDLNLTDFQKMQMHNENGFLHDKLGNYDKAESEFKMAVGLADFLGNIHNQIQYRQNLAALLYKLTEYDRALDYYAQVYQLLKQSNLENSEYHLDLFIDIDFVRILTNSSRPEVLRDFIKQALQWIEESSHQPSRQAFLLFTIGQINLGIGEYTEALKNFIEAEDIFDRNGFLQDRLQNKMGVAKTLTKMNNFRAAKKKSLEVLKLAKKYEELEIVLDAIALLAEVEHRQGNNLRAIELSNQLMPRIEDLSSRFSNPDRLTSFRHKIYDYLKNAVVYELSQNRFDFAFSKLDYAKARSLKPTDAFSNGKSNPINFIDFNLVNTNLDNKSLVLDYMITQDTLYAFMVTTEGNQLLKKRIDSNELQTTVYQYKTLIDKTIQIFQNYSPIKAREHFKATSQLGRKLFEELLGWPSLKTQLDNIEVLYIIPDDFLFELPFSTLTVDSSTYLIHKVTVITSSSSSFLMTTNKSLEIQNITDKKTLISVDSSLPGATELSSFLRHTFPSGEELEVNGEISKQLVLEKLNGEYDFFIIVGHGMADSKYPEHSYIEFNVRSTTTDRVSKIRLTVEDLKKANWSKTSMVLLVGCETGGGRLYRGTGIAGLQQSFLSEGVENVLASLWKIEANRTLMQIQDFILTWTTVSSPATALREMQLKAIEKLRNSKIYQFPHPYYWGSYILLHGVKEPHMLKDNNLKDNNNYRRKHATY